MFLIVVIMEYTTTQIQLDGKQYRLMCFMSFLKTGIFSHRGLYYYSFKFMKIGLWSEQ